MNIQRLLCFATVAALMAPGTVFAQGLVDAAKKEKERRAMARAKNGEAKVYTGTPSAPDAAPEVVAPSPAPETTSGNSAGSAKPRPLVSKEVASARSSRNVSVTLYVTSWCQYCRKAREFLSRQPNVRVEVHDIEASKARRSEMLSKTGGATGVPVIDVEGIILRGYSGEAITQALARVRSR